MPIQARWMSRYAALIAVVLALSGCNGSEDSDSASSSGSGGQAPSQLDSDSGGQQVQLQWSEQEDVDSYNLYYATGDAIQPANFGIWREEHDGVKVSGVTGGSHTVDELEAGTTYYFVMTSVTDGEESGPSNEVSATPEDSGPQFSKLNDTGVRSCNLSDDGESYGEGGYGDCPQGGHPAQDAQVGRGAAAAAGELDKEGAGTAGFDFTKIDAEGNELPADAEEWTCVRDNHTGLMWEVKRSGTGMRGLRATYSWYDPDDPTYGDGAPNMGSNCGAIPCDTHHYVQAVNDQGLCGASDWRMPTVNELHSITTYMNGVGTSLRRHGLPLDPDFFPKADADYTNYDTPYMWARNPFAGNRNGAWAVSRPDGRAGAPSANRGRACTIGGAARLVREVDDTETSTAPASDPARGEPIPAAADSCVGNLSPTTPSSEFTALEDGSVVHHEATGLEWRRCPAGMDWNGESCSGSAKKMSWKAALQYAADKDDWRLPNINELRSIVERCREEPAVNQEVFPGTGSSWYLTSTPARQEDWPQGFGSSGFWQVDFGRGASSFTNNLEDRGDRYGQPPSPKKVRLVRFAE